MTLEFQVKSSFYAFLAVFYAVISWQLTEFINPLGALGAGLLLWLVITALLWPFAIAIHKKHIRALSWFLFAQLIYVPWFASLLFRPPLLVYLAVFALEIFLFIKTAFWVRELKKAQRA